MAALLLCLAFAPLALANSWNLPGRMTLLFERPVYIDYTRGAADEGTASGYPVGLAAFEMMRGQGYERVLFLLEEGVDGWETVVENVQALYQGYASPEIVLDDAGYLSLSYQRGTTTETYVFANRSGVWKLSSAEVRPQDGMLMTVSTERGVLTCLEAAMIVGIAMPEGLPLAEFSVERFPKTLAEAIAISEGLIAWGFPLPGGVTVTCEAGGSVPVYSGPGEMYARTGKAQMDMNAPFVIYGEESNYYLVQYWLDAGHARFGFVEKGALPGVSAPPLSLKYQPAMVAQACAVTDDPIYGQAETGNLKAGDAVTFLAVLWGDWAFVEYGGVGGTPARGFIRTECLANP